MPKYWVHYSNDGLEFIEQFFSKFTCIGNMHSTAL